MAAADPVLILAFVRVGDLVQLTTLAKGFKRSRPDSPVAVCVLPEFVKAAELMDGVDEIIPVDRDALLRLSLRNDLPLKAMLAESAAVLEPLLSRKFRIAVNMTHTHVSAMLMYLVQAPDKRGPVMTSSGLRSISHPWMRFLHAYIAGKEICPFNLVDMCAMTGEPETGAEPIPVSIRISEAASAWASEFLGRECPGNGPVVAIHMGASDDHKIWHPSSFTLACRRIRERMGNVRFLFIGGEGERRVAERAHAFLDAPGSAVAAGKTDLAQLAALLERCDLLVTNDTGPMHIAAAAGTRVLSIALGPIHYSNTAPYGEGHLVFQPRVACAPCSFHVRCVNPECKNMVTPDAVADAALRILEGDPFPVRSIPDSPAYLGCNLYATEWGADGLLDYRPLVDRPPDFRERLVCAYRKVWLGSLDGEGVMPGERNVVPGTGTGITPALLGLESLALKGRDTASDIAKHSRSPHRQARFEEGLKTIRDCGRAVREIGQTVPEVNSLCTMFAFEEENMAEGGLEAAARENAALFGKLLRRTRSLAYLLAVADVTLTPADEGRG